MEKPLEKQIFAVCYMLFGSLPESTLQAGPCVVVLEVLCLLAPEGLQSEESLVWVLTGKAMAKSLSQYV